MAQTSATTIVLDTNAILQAPSTVSFKTVDVELLVPPAVLSELGKSSAISGSAIPSLLAQASIAGTVVIPESSPFHLAPPLPELPRLSEADRQVLSVAYDAKRRAPERRVVVASDDKHIASASARLGIETISAKQVASMLQRGGGSQPLKAQVAETAATERRMLWKGLGLGVLVGAGATLSLIFGRQLLETVRYWGAAPALVLVAVALFRLRIRMRFAYGMAEFLFGLLTGVYSAFRALDALGSSLAVLLPIVAALYVMVRGLDNIGQGLQATSKAPLWNRLFPVEA